MIARIWHGYTKPEHADAYEAMLKPELLPGIGKVKGYQSSYLLRRDLGEEWALGKNLGKASFSGDFEIL